ncbi:hypothetical protein [Hymenobacter koreensis]
MATVLSPLAHLLAAGLHSGGEAGRWMARAQQLKDTLTIAALNHQNR